MYWIFPYLCIRNELFDSIAPQNAENRTVANSLLLFLKCSVKCLFLKWLCQTVENLKYNCMEDKDKIIASLRKQLKEAVSRCNALEQENALLSYQLEKMEERCPESH